MDSFFNSARKKLAGGFVVIAIAAISFGAGIAAGPRINPDSTLAAVLTVFGAPTPTPPQDVDLTPLWKAWNLFNDRFVPATTTNIVTDEERLWGTIAGLAASHNDPHTVFLPPVENKIFNEDISGSFAGAGMEIGFRNRTLTVVAPLKDSPAEKAGLKAGDMILAIDGEITDGTSLEKAVSKIRGEKGTKVTLTIYRESEGKPRDVSLTRDVIKIPTIDTEHRSDGIYVIRLYNFGATSPNEFRTALRSFVLSGSNKLVLDLRNNPGGYLEAAADIGSWFLPAGKVVAEEYYGGKKDSVYHRSKGYNIFANENLTMAILVNEGSASASEILAGALQEHGVAKVIGTRTFGKGSVQELIPLTSNPESSLKLTIAQWHTPNGKSISDGGLVPDFFTDLHSSSTPSATSTPVEVDPLEDLQFDRALQYLKTGK